MVISLTVYCMNTMEKKTTIAKSISCRTIEDGAISIMANHEKKNFNLVKNSQLTILHRNLSTETMEVNSGYIVTNGKEADLFLSIN